MMAKNINNCYNTPTSKRREENNSLLSTAELDSEWNHTLDGEDKILKISPFSWALFFFIGEEDIEQK